MLHCAVVSLPAPAMLSVDCHTPPFATTYVVVPAFNEAKVISGVVGALSEVFANVVVVNDGSSDDTSAVLKDTAATVIRHPVNVGQGAALQTGITYALERGAAYIVTFDADGQHRVEDAIAVLQLVQTGTCDVACGSRFLGKAVNIPITRRMLIRTAVYFSNATTGTKLTDTHNGLRALSRRAASCLDMTQSGMAHASEIINQLAQHKMTIREVPVQILYTEYSMTKGQSSLNAVNILIDLIVGRFLK
jgi:polyprenyl-phospho-N-acetylgalactosaminyl synthase